MKNKIKLYLTLWIILFTFLSVNAQCETVMKFFKDDIYTSKELVAFVENDPQKAFDSWKLLYNEKTGLAKSIDELNLVSKNLDEINKAGGYLKWKSLSKTEINLTFSTLTKSNLNKLDVSDDINKYVLAPNSKGGAYILPGISVEAKEIALADEVFALTNQKCIFPKNNLEAIEGFFEDGTGFTMKELESNFQQFYRRINEMSSKIKKDKILNGLVQKVI
ncbi:hypothetical protein IUY40_00090 [Flavobacterium sp. ALJ2]|uniref:hypothetical protein n=1 Tax=Flavobacterium sp. ALJ2 TaxID=2786960 RepID=UPI00189E98B0|nr:hypothetical protein [Flavobacterium sp. ALJ2]MBF7089949.1 hypothetical protein [Flavobacterium sp. ALJ2]